MSSGTLWTSVAFGSAFFGDDVPDRLCRCTYLRITCGSGWAGSLFTPVWLELPVVLVVAEQLMLSKQLLQLLLAKQLLWLVLAKIILR